MRFSLTLLIAVFFFAESSAENQPKIFQNSLIEITASTEQCHDIKNGLHQEYKFLTIKNLTAQKVEVSYNKEMWYDGKCMNCNKTSEEYRFKVILEPNQSVSGNCGKKDKALSIFSKMLDMKKSELTKFEIKNIEVKTLSK